MHTRFIVSNTAEAWRKYVSVGAIAADLLRPHVLRAWVRSHEHGASPWVARAEALSAGQTERLQAGHARLISAARPYLDLLSRAAGAERHAVMLGSAEAILLDVVGDEQTVSGPERVPGPGALLSEAMCGSNGVGTPLAENRYVEIVSTEHFIHGFHPFTCHGIPIENLAGEPDGVLSVSVRQPETAERLHEILVCAAYGIATDLARLRLVDEVTGVVATGRRASLDPLHAALVQVGVMSHGVDQRAAAPGREPGQAMTELVRLAGDAIRELERRGRDWLELSSDELEAPSRLALVDEIADLVAALAPEARRRRVEVTFGRELEAVTSIADRRKLRRDAFRLLLRGFDAAEGGGVVTIDIGREPSTALCYVRLEAAPGPTRPGEKTLSALVCRGA